MGQSIIHHVAVIAVIIAEIFSVEWRSFVRAVVSLAVMHDHVACLTNSKIVHVRLVRIYQHCKVDAFLFSESS